ncbi:MAG: hypothetical protein FJX56_10445 [Alphaproteobacteria bacterium]|nr:hypothetical protein [Alphaproteobacteria bacterium]
MGRGAGSLLIDVIRPAPGVALIHTASPVHDEYFFIATGEHSLAITVRDSGAKSLPEPRVHVLHKPYDWDMTPASDPPSAVDDQDLLMKVWQLLGSD